MKGTKTTTAMEPGAKDCKQASPQRKADKSYIKTTSLPPVESSFLKKSFNRKAREGKCASGERRDIRVVLMQGVACPVFDGSENREEGYQGQDGVRVGKGSDKAALKRKKSKSPEKNARSRSASPLRSSIPAGIQLVSSLPPASSDVAQLLEEIRLYMEAQEVHPDLHFENNSREAAQQELTAQEEALLEKEKESIQKIIPAIQKFHKNKIFMAVQRIHNWFVKCQSWRNKNVAASIIQAAWHSYQERRMATLADEGEADESYEEAEEATEALNGGEATEALNGEEAMEEIVEPVAVAPAAV